MASTWSRKDREGSEANILAASSSALSTGTEFATGKISLGYMILTQLSSFEDVWSTLEGGLENKGATFFKPVNIPLGFSCLGYCSKPNARSSEGWVLVAKSSCRERNHSSSFAHDVCSTAASGKRSGFPIISSSHDPESSLNVDHNSCHKPALISPLGYTMVWSSKEWNGKANGTGYFWLPISPVGYTSLGHVVTRTAMEPSTQEVMCVRLDLTDVCRKNELLWETITTAPFSVWNVVPLTVGSQAKGINVGTFYCSTNAGTDSMPIACLKNTESSLSAMPSLAQVHTLMRNCGPTIFFHSHEKYFPSSVSWFFGKGVLLYSKEKSAPVLISSDGSNLPVGGTDDGEYWINLPNDGSADMIKAGNLLTAEVYVHVKPILGGTFTDLATWIFYPFNGAATAKIEWIDIDLGKIGEHVSDWEHFTLRINNFTGKVSEVFLSQHSGGEWVDASDLEYSGGSKSIIYSSKHGHAIYPHPGLVLQGDHNVGIRNDTARSNYFFDSSKSYQIISAEYLNGYGNGMKNVIEEPIWLQYMRKWGPKIQYDSHVELEKVLGRLPPFLRSQLRSFANKFPDEIFGEEGPTGPKQRDSWFGDEKI